MKTVTVIGNVTVSCAIDLDVPDDATEAEILAEAEKYEERVEFQTTSSFSKRNTFYIGTDGVPFELEIEK